MTLASEVQIRLLGRAEVTSRTGIFDCPPRSVLCLLAYLVLNGDRHKHRSSISTAFWPETPESQARRRLNTSLWRLKKFIEVVLPGASESVILVEGDDIAFNASGPCRADLSSFLAAADLLRRSPVSDLEMIAELERATSLYRGDLLEGIHEEWVLRERERLAQAYLSMLEFLGEWHHKLGNLDDAIRYGTMIIDRDPLRESVHRALMQLHLERGDRSAALRQFDQCRQALHDELGISPMPETMLTAARIRHPAAIPSDLDGIDVTSALERLRTAREHARDLHEALSDAIAALEHARPS